MLSKKMLTALNDQVNAELHSAYIYLSMAAYFAEENLPGMAAWMTLQESEERVHAMKFYHYIIERRGRVTLQAVEAPPATWDSPLAAFEAALEHEQYISGRIHTLVKLAKEEGDYPTESFLKWFVDEQVEEEDNVGSVVDDLKRAEGYPPALFMLDRELGARQAEPAAAE
ncbi:MAG: ferritin [Anaerolineae bacterium]|nr:ferritin [Anaerolineae bacterium]